MAQIGLSEAARLTGRNQSTIHRALKAGRLSYSLDAAGARQIDTAELDRVFGVNGSSGAMPDAMAHATKSNSAHAGEVAALQRLIEEQAATIADLRARLDVEAEERRRLTAVLTHRQAGSVPAVSAAPARSWWRRWVR